MALAIATAIARRIPQRHARSMALYLYLPLRGLERSSALPRNREIDDALASISTALTGSHPAGTSEDDDD